MSDREPDAAADLLTALYKHICLGHDSVGRPLAWLDSAAYGVVAAALSQARREGEKAMRERAAKLFFKGSATSNAIRSLPTAPKVIP